MRTKRLVHHRHRSRPLRGCRGFEPVAARRSHRSNRGERSAKLARVGRRCSHHHRVCAPPAPQRLQRIFLPARSGFVANFRPHAGQANLKARAGWSGSPMVSMGAGTVAVFPQSPHVMFRPICDHSTSVTSPQAWQVNGIFIRDPTFTRGKGLALVIPCSTTRKCNERRNATPPGVDGPINPGRDYVKPTCQMKTFFW